MEAVASGQLVKDLVPKKLRKKRAKKEEGTEQESAKVAKKARGDKKGPSAAELPSKQGKRVSAAAGGGGAAGAKAKKARAAAAKKLAKQQAGEEEDDELGASSDEEALYEGAEGVKEPWEEGGSSEEEEEALGEPGGLGQGEGVCGWKGPRREAPCCFTEHLGEVAWQPPSRTAGGGDQLHTSLPQAGRY